MNIDVRKSSTVGSINELGLDARICNVLKDAPVDEVIRVARMGTLLTYRGLGKSGAEKVRRAMSRAGLFCQNANGYRRLLIASGVLEPPKTNAEYEAQIAINDAMIAEIDLLVQKTFYERELELVITSFDLNGKSDQMTARSLAQHYGITEGQMYTVRKHVLLKLRCPYRRAQLCKIVQQYS